ncbi:cuticle protein 19-like [Helicoverpa zea]|uniref:cuticle protein 19-like n=1 Tax=Helicoverpa zea TaxID=7113 RepID=UPI001F5AA226|nr:cuticle protein 19-like [Helicoverpa zea]
MVCISLKYIVHLETSEDIELRRIFPSEFPQDTVRKSGSADPEHLGRFAELKSYFKYPKAKVNAHFEELICYEKNDKKMCRIDVDRYSPEEDMYYMSPAADSHVDRRRFVVLALVTAACAAPQNQQDVQIVRYDVNNAGLDSYSFAWELSDGSKHEEQGQLKNQGTENEAIAVQGQYVWVGPDGVTYTVTYLADENGFQPQIQQGPGGAIPSAVVASLLG